MNKKGQAAMEFLMTYGWAIIVVLAAIGALAYFGVLSPSNLLPEKTTFQAPIPSVDNAVVTAGAANAGTIEIAFRNNVGSTINVTNVTSADGDCGDIGTGSRTIAVEGGAESALPVTIQNGQAFVLKFTCSSALVAKERFDSDITFFYYNHDSTLTKPHQGSVKGKVI